MDIILASSSPRRRVLVEGLGVAFRIVIPAVDETPRRGESTAIYVRRVACDKAREAAASVKEESVVLAGDTVVSIDHHLLGKPVDEAEACRMLRRLSGRVHQVVGAVCVCRARRGAVCREHSQVVTTAVEFKELSEREIAAYVATGEPLDKAGAYAIQGGAAYMVRRIEGSYSNVVGLPLAETVALLEKEAVWRSL